MLVSVLSLFILAGDLSRSNVSSFHQVLFRVADVAVRRNQFF